MSKPNRKAVALKTKATLEAKAKAYASQKIVINDEWSVIRADDLNWQIRYTGKSQATKKLGMDRWFFGSVRMALVFVFDKALDANPTHFMMGQGRLIDLAARIETCLARLQG